MSLADTQTIPVMEARMGDWRLSLRRRGYDAQDLAKLYDAKASKWNEALSNLRVESAYSQIHSQLMADLKPNDKVLDCGIGTGALSKALLKTIPYALNIHGIDISPEMIKTAKTEFKNLGENAELSVGDIQHIDYPDNYFDRVMSAHTLEHMAQPEIALSEMLRVLRPGGRFLICVTNRSWLGRYVQMNWRTWTVSEQQALSWLTAFDVEDIQFIKVKNRRVFNQMSLVFTGTKV